MPPLSLHYKTKLFDENDDFETTNNVLKLKMVNMKRGHIEKVY